MGFDDVSDGEGYVKFNKGTNILGRIQNIDQGTDSYQGDEYYQLELAFNAVPEQGGEEGRIPAWITSKITVRDSEEHTSNLAKLLQAAGVLRPVVQDLVAELDADESLIDLVVSGDKRFEAESESENIALMKAVATHIDGKVLRMGTKWNSSEDYSVVKDFYGLSDSDPFSADEGGQQPAVDSSDETGQSSEGEDLLSS